MPTVYFDAIPNAFKQQFTRVRRTFGSGRDTYGDATFTESRTTGFRGTVEYTGAPGQTVILAGKELRYDIKVFTSATMIVGENDVILAGSSEATTLATRYHVQGVDVEWNGATIDHKIIYGSREVR